MIDVSYRSGNASTWAWLHLRFPKELSKGGNIVLAGAIDQLDPDFVQVKISGLRVSKCGTNSKSRIL